MTVVQIAPAVWISVTDRGHAGNSEHPADLAAARNLPHWRRTEHLAARSLLRDLLRRVAAEAAEAVLATEPGGRPYLTGHADLGISVSHDSRLVAAAVARGRSVGVDVQEAINPVHPRTARRVLGPHAPAVLAMADSGGYELAAVWSAQEACVKAAGTGLAGRPWTVPVPPYQSSGRWRDYRWVTLRRLPAPVSAAFTESTRSSR